ncbi:MAG TPA: acyl-CoA dehydrogenase family protein [Candidatus Xenobia bacterium]|jgi:hypothetical protein
MSPTAVSATPNFYLADHALREALASALPAAAVAWAEPKFQTMGEAAAGPLDELAMLADKHPPVLHPRDRHGNRVDHLEFHPAYRELQKFGYGEGLIHHYYQEDVRQTLGDAREVVKLAHGYLFSQAEQGLFCPMCMTDGSAFLVETYGSAAQKAAWLPHLTSQNLDTLWEGGMWLTEKAGGSDVGANETRATKDGERWRLNGEKFFCSNAGAEMVMVLARPDGAPQGTKGLGLFALRRHRDDGSLNGLHLERLKDKLGTRSMPTGEVLLHGAEAEAIGDVSRGFLHMTDMLNLSRLYNATASLSGMRRALTEALQYAAQRVTFGAPILSRPLVRQTLVEMAVEHEGGLHLWLSVAHHRGRILTGKATDVDRKLSRLWTPLLKYTTARTAVRVLSEAVEMLGGNGYIEDWPLARLYRDAQVLPIWEGTTNILVMDTLRAVHKDGAFEAWKGWMAAVDVPELQEAVRRLEARLPAVLSASSEADDASRRLWCDRLVQVTQAALMRQRARTVRAQAAAEHYLLRHFGEDRHDLSPSWMAQALSSASVILG